MPKHGAGPWLLCSRLFCLEGSTMQQMGERKQLSPDLLIAQKTIAFMLCLYNPCFPASDGDPDKDSETNKMPVGGPLTPRANCAGVRDSMMSGLSPPFVAGARGKLTGQGEKQNHGRSSRNHPMARAAWICNHPRCPSRPGCRSLFQMKNSISSSSNLQLTLPSNAETVLGRSQGTLICPTLAT